MPYFFVFPYYSVNAWCLVMWKKKFNYHWIPVIFRVQEHGGETIIPFSCALERNLADMPPDEAAKYCEENKTQRSVQSICCTVVKCLIAKLGTLLWLCYG